MKKYLYYSLYMALFFLTACGGDEDLENNINFESPYVITDNPNDPIQHQRYLIYQKYGVPVFFNDTISEKKIGTGYDGNPIYQYETLDFNWSFSSHNKDKVEYIIEYLPEEYFGKALQFAEAFLAEASKPMRPFAMFFPKSFAVKQNDKTDTPDFSIGFRTLTIPNIQVMEEQGIKDFSHDILLDLVKVKVKKVQSLVDEFGKTSEQKYGRPWVTQDNNGGLGCQWGVKHEGVYWKPRTLFDDGIVDRYIQYSFKTYVTTEEEFIAERDIIFNQIGQFGFICGDEDYDHLNSPKDVLEDLDYYLDTMLAIGEETFLERYGKSSLVVKKYNLLADYIRNELEVNF